MAKQSPSLYSVSKTFVWFAIVSIALTACLAAIVILDHEREWKQWQKQFIALKVQKAKDELKAAQSTTDKKALESADEKLDEAKRSYSAKQAEREKALKERAAADTKFVRAKAAFQELKQFEDSYRYYFEEYRLHKDARAKEYEGKLNQTSAKVRELKRASDESEAALAEADARVASFGSELKEAEKAVASLLEEQKKIERRLQKIEPTPVKEILNAPMLDFIAPSIKVQQIVLDNLHEDYHFAKVHRVDRCTTCHMGIDQKGFEDAPQPFRTHPKLELFLGSGSPHSIEKFGCTSCHGGSGQALSFIETAHTPRNEEQKKEWEKKHHWHEMHHWENKMLPLQHTEASCVKCHQGVAEVPQAPKLNAGRKMAEQVGCVNCHKVQGFEQNWKVGPDLRSVKTKLTEEWIAKWLEDPTVFRASTHMPRIFNLTNTSTPEDKARNEAAIHSIAAYLLKNSNETALPQDVPSGDAAKGETLVKSLGCLGCHSAAGVDAGKRGPELSSLGSKVTAPWLYQWLKDPKHLSPDTRMPNLRLGDQEAADITAYLLSQKNDSFDSAKTPRAKMEVVDAMILDSLQGTMRRSEAEAQLKKMSGEDKLQFLGKKSIAHQGCYGCHEIQGFEKAPAVGTELSDEGRKPVDKFDFGFIEIEKTRQDWVHQKLLNPRSFDDGRVRQYYEKLRMPQFNLTEEERQSLVTFVLSLNQENIPLEMRRRLSSDEAKVEEGRWLVKKLNCQGCHTMDGTDAILRQITEDAGQAPPILNGEGAKVQEDWLHDFLAAPTTIRPWLKYRMPTFGLSDGDLNKLVLYFHHRDHQQETFGSHQIPSTTDEMLSNGKSLFEQFQCVKCHQVNAESAAMGSSFLAPDLTLTKHRLKAAWVHQWIRDPQTLQEGTMMPTFFADGQTPLPDVLGGDTEKQITAIQDYLYRYETGGEKEPSKKA